MITGRGRGLGTLGAVTDSLPDQWHRLSVALITNGAVRTQTEAFSSSFGNL